MIIPTITTYLYDIQHNKGFIIAQIQHKRTMHLATLGAAVTIVLVLWILL
jgi:hypothetical protein